MVPLEPDGSVHCVAFSPNGGYLAVGLGWYPLDSLSPARAEVQLFSVADPSLPMAKRALPGVAVDRMLFCVSEDLLVAVTGARTQNRGFVVLLEYPTLGILEVAETNAAMYRALLTDPWESLLLLCSSGGIEARTLRRPWQVEWDRCFPDDPLLAVAFCEEREWIYLSDGNVVDLAMKDVGHLSPLPECSGLVVLDEHRVAGISSTGTLRVWKLETEPGRP